MGVVLFITELTIFSGLVKLSSMFQNVTGNNGAPGLTLTERNPLRILIGHFFAFSWTLQVFGPCKLKNCLKSMLVLFFNPRCLHVAEFKLFCDLVRLSLV